MGRSLACPGYEKYSVSTESNELFSWSPSNSIQAFDDALLKYVGSPQDSNLMQIYYRCDSYTNDTSKEIASLNANILYRRSVVCAQVISGTNGLLNCYNQSQKFTGTNLENVINLKRDLNSNKPVPSNSVEENKPKTEASIPKPLCKSTCLKWANSVVDMFKNKNACGNTASTDTSQAQKSINLLCEQYPLNGENDCISGEQNELNTCGFRNIYGWCSNCEYSKKFSEQCNSVNSTLTSSFFNGDVFLNSTSSLEKSINSQKNENDKTKKEIKGQPDNNNKNDNNNTVEQTSEDDKSQNADNDGDSNNESKSPSNSKNSEKSFKTISIALGILLLLLICLISIFFVLLLRSKQRLFLKNLFSKDSEEFDRFNRFDKSEMDPLSKQIMTKNTRTSENLLNPEVDFVDMFLKSVGVPRVVLHSFFAKREDEISLKPSERVQIQIVFDDGWAVGKNLNTGKEGSFPLMCVIKNLPNQMPQSWSDLEKNKEAHNKNIGFDGVDTEDYILYNQSSEMSQQLKASSRKSSDADSKRSSNTKSSLFSLSNINKDNQMLLRNQQTIETPTMLANKNKASADPALGSISKGLNFIPTESARYANAQSAHYDEYYDISPKRPSNVVHK
ncbi:hypothetical protein BB561_005454 [Smittium simulii]|uniref:SH3 domain-containing protein n=1 Tax=Smittium simulii TaxID=133385 RepID=A0A2T9YAA3_9FUNG|nr:hypothetical protein BB561_005454 [Smittium simulii]